MYLTATNLTTGWIAVAASILTALLLGLFIDRVRVAVFRRHR